MELQPGESRELIFLLGYAENDPQEKWENGVLNKRKAKEMIARFDSVEKVDSAFAALRIYWDQSLGNFRVKTGEEKLTGW